MKKILAGTTKQVTWVASGVTATTISTAILDREENLVSSLSMTSSGNGHYFAAVTYPNTEAYYVQVWNAVVSTKPYKDRERFKIVLSEVD